MSASSLGSAQGVPLLKTKLYIPPARPELVPRPRLVERLGAGFDRKLTLVSAPAGFGKTTLLSECAARWRRPVAWVSLDKGDNDPARYWAYLVGALQTVYTGVGEAARKALQSLRPPPIEEVLTVLINEIADQSEGTVLILDDYHLIETQPIHDAVGFWLDHMPQNIHLVISTRVEPPLPLARWRVRGELAELGQADLRFTPEETAAFLNQAMNLGLSEGDVAAIEACTEGWIAGLQLAALSLQGRGAARGQASAKTYGGDHPYVIDYLAEEVLWHQTEEIREFLWRTAILDRLTAPLCNAVTGRDDAAVLLEELERANLFIVPLNGERRWYRYHHLFAEFLRTHLQQLHPEWVPDLHRRAARWFEAEDLHSAAVDHALLAEDFAWAAQLMEQIAEETFMRSEIATFLGWVEALPDDLVRVRSSLCLFHAWALLLAGRPLDAVHARLQDAEEEADQLPVQAAVLRAFIAALQGRMPRAVELSLQALQRLPADDPFLRSVVTWNEGITYLWDGELVAAGLMLEQAMRVSREIDNIMVAVVALCHLAELRVIQGRLVEAEELYEQALDLALDPHRQRLPIAGMALIGLAELQRERNKLEAATANLNSGLDLTRGWGIIGALDGYVTLARVRQAQGDVAGSQEAIQQAAQLAGQIEATDMAERFAAAHQARLRIAQHDVDPDRLGAALRWTEERRIPADLIAEKPGRDSFTETYLRELEHTTLARLLIQQDRPAEALTLLVPLIRAPQQQGRHGILLEIRLLAAMAHWALGDASQAMDMLGQALARAETEGYVRIFLDEGEPMARLLRQAASRGIAVEYIGRLLSEFEREEENHATFRQQVTDDVSSPSRVTGPSVLIEPLTERELEVLRLLAVGLYNREIAEELVVAMSTVKWHVNNIYSKLGVHSRTQAIARARELGLL